MEDLTSEQIERDTALTEMRERLADGMARARLSKTQLAKRAGLGRTTVQLAFQADAPAPSAQTAAALARALRLPVEELLELRRAAAGQASSCAGEDQGPGRPVSQWDPHDLEVHPAGLTPGHRYEPGSATEPILPGYVPREHDRVLAGVVRDAARGRSRMLVLIGTSSTGKTRACWEAVQPLAAKGWRLWHPFDPTRARAALDDLERVRPHTVVWLNDAQHYIGDRRAGERIAAAVHALITRPDRGPILVLGTLWPEYADQYTALPDPGTPDPHSRVRELLTRCTLSIPDGFTSEALRQAAKLAENGDRLLADALTRARTSGRVTQDLAGAPELLRRYEHSTPTAKAVVEAAMDARRLGAGLHLPQPFLTDAAIDYIRDHDYEQLPEDWAEQVFADLAHPVHGKQAPLRRTEARPKRQPPGRPAPSIAPAPMAGPMFRLADYLEQHGRTTRRLLCPPASFWHAAHAHFTHPDDLSNLANAAEDRHRLEWAHYLRRRAAQASDTCGLVSLALSREEAGDREDAERLARQAADTGDPFALFLLAESREEAGDREDAERLYHAAADARDPFALYVLTLRREEAGDREDAERLARQAADTGATCGLVRLAEIREEAGDREDAERLARQAADTGETRALVNLAMRREEAGDREDAERLYRAANDSDRGALYLMALRREEAGDREDAERLARQAADTGDTRALVSLAEIREEAGDREDAERLARQAADGAIGITMGQPLKDRWPYGLDPDGTPMRPWS